MKISKVKDEILHSCTENEDQDSSAVGIDLGTTNSLIAISQNFIAQVIEDPNTGDRLLPSILYYGNDKVYVGKEAQEFVGHISSIKRLMGKGISDIQTIMGLSSVSLDESSSNTIVRLNVNGGSLTPIEISADILKALKARAEIFLNKRISKAVITVPAYFDDASRNATKDAAKLANLEVLRLINEPTAAAIAYGLNQNAEGIFLVYDLGGGTFDISILKMQQGILKVIVTGGDANLGGDDFDQALLEFIFAKYPHQQLSNTHDLAKALIKTRAIKEALSTQMKWEGEFPFIKENCIITRAELNIAIKKLIDKTIKLLRNTIKEAELQISQIDEIILVGGATRTVAVKESIFNIFHKAALYNINPEEIVAIGAAIQAENLSKGNNTLLLDVTPLSLGIELMGGISEIIIPRNSPIPMEVTKKYTTYKSNQTGFLIHVIQGESEHVEKCRSLAHFELKNIPALPAGQAQILITFKVDVDGLLTVTAEEKTTSTKQEIEVKPAYGLSEEEILKLIQISQDH